MIIKWIKRKDKSINDITSFVSGITWSGSVNQASRQLEIFVLYSPLDKNIKDINIKLGDRLKLYTDDKILLINAMVYNRERLSEQGMVTYSGYDDLYHLLRSNCTYNFKNTTPERIVEKIGKDFKVKTGVLQKTNIPIKKMLIESESAYTTIMKAYTKAYENTKKKYMPIMVNQTLHVIEKGEIIEDYYLQDTINITSSSYQETIENMVNQVKIYDDKGKQIGEVKKENWIDSYGIFQEVYTKEEGVNQITAAKSLFMGITKEVHFEAFGNVTCISGYGIKVKDSLTGLSGIFWIDTDSHTWSDGAHTMSLDLTFKNLMDLQEIEDTEAKASGVKTKASKKSKKTKVTAEENSSAWYVKSSKMFHSQSTCSGMRNANKITVKEANQKDLSKCKKCWSK